MTSTNEPKATKKRTGRKRLPPLAPGPALQFVVASHPDDFKADDTMRNVRSHVMYKHREHQGNKRSRSASYRAKSAEGETRPASLTRTPSPMTTVSGRASDERGFLVPSSRQQNALWDNEFHKILSRSTSTNPARNLATRIIAAITADPARSSPATFAHISEYPLPCGASCETASPEDLKTLYIQTNDFCQCHDEAWMRFVCSTDMSFLSNLSATCVFHDLQDGLLDDSPLTVYAKTKLLSMIKESLQETETSTSDFTALSILHLLVSEVGGSSEEVFDAHMEGLVRIVHQRGGLEYLGAEGRIAAFLTIFLLTFAILRSQPEPSMLQGFLPNLPSAPLVLTKPPISPIYAPNADVSALYPACSDACYQIICDMHELTNVFIHRWTYSTNPYPQASLELASYDVHMQQIYSRLLLRPSTDPHRDPDWVYESCRLAALIYCRSIVQGVPLSDSASVMHAPSRGGPGALSGVTLLTALHEALGYTDTTSNWEDLYGVLLWVCLVGGAASWHSCAQSTVYVGSQSHDGEYRAAAWARKCFALFAVRSSLVCGFHQVNAMLDGQRRMLRVQELIEIKRGIASQ